MRSICIELVVLPCFSDVKVCRWMFVGESNQDRVYCKAMLSNRSKNRRMVKRCPGQWTGKKWRNWINVESKRTPLMRFSKRKIHKEIFASGNAIEKASNMGQLEFIEIHLCPKRTWYSNQNKKEQGTTNPGNAAVDRMERRWIRRSGKPTKRKEEKR